MAGTFMVGAIGFFLGFMVGGCIANRYSGKDYTNRIEQLEHENAELREELHDISGRFDEHTKKVDELEKDISNKVTSSVGNHHEQYAKLASNYKQSRDEYDDHFAYREYPGETDDEYDYDDIYLITEAEFEKDFKVRDNATLTFYQEDGVLIDEGRGDAPITNQQDIIGIECLDELENTEQDRLYVSNDIQNKVYEIIVEHNQSYYRDVLGIG